MGGAGGLTPRLGLTAGEATPAHAAACRSLGDLQGSILPFFAKVVTLPRWGYRFWGLEPCLGGTFFATQSFNGQTPAGAERARPRASPSSAPGTSGI